jgi:hypothetical protein
MIDSNYLCEKLLEIFFIKNRLGQLFHLTSYHSCPLCKVANDSLQHLFFDFFFLG